MKNCIFYIVIFCGGLILQPLYFNDAHGSDPLPESRTESNELLPLSPDIKEPHAPVDSFFFPPFDDTPVAMIDDESITKYDLSIALAGQGKQVSDDPEERKKEYMDVLERLIRSRLIIEEAMNIGLDERPEVTTQIENFKRATLQQELVRNHLHELEPDPAEVEELYQKMSREVKLYSLVFPAGPEARRFLEEVKDGDFEQIAARYIGEGKATEKEDEQYVKIKDLRPEIGQEVYSMEMGGLSKIYLTEDGHLLYKLVDARFVEDQSVREEAVRLVTEKARTDKAREYATALQEKYVILDEELYKQLDFDAGIDQLLEDKRVLAKARLEDAPPFVVTVADLAAKIKAGFFHGADKAAKLEIINERKKVVISNMIFTYTSELEAQHLGLDQTEEFKRKVEDFERSTLFNTFMNRILLPEVKVTEEETRAYYDQHLDEFSSSAMLRMKSLVFNNQQDAESALDKLRKGADYNWVSANAANLVAQDTQGVLPLNRNLLSLTTLPEDLHEAAEGAKKGDSFVYAPSEGGFFYVLLVEDAFAPEPQSYEQARAEAGQKVFSSKIEKLLNEWVSKLKEAYDVRILLNDSGE